MSRKRGKRPGVCWWSNLVRSIGGFYPFNVTINTKSKVVTHQSASRQSLDQEKPQPSQKFETRPGIRAYKFGASDPYGSDSTQNEAI